MSKRPPGTSMVLLLLVAIGCAEPGAEVVGLRRTLTVSAEQPLTAPGIPAPMVAGNERPTVAIGGGIRLVVHRDFEEWGLFVQRFDAADGKALDPSRILITPSSDSQPARGKSTYVSAIYGGSRFLVVWETWHGQICAVRIEANGTVLDRVPLQLSWRQVAHQGNPAVAFDGTNYLIAWGDSTHYASENVGIVPVDIRGVRMRASDGVLLGLFWINRTPGVHSQPALSFDGTNFVAAWQKQGGGIHGTRIRPSDGMVLDEAGLSLYPTAGVQGRPALAFDGTNHVLVWQEGSAIKYGRFSPALARLDGTGTVLDSGAEVSAPAVAVNGNRALVSWYRASGPDALELSTARVEAAGATVTASTPALLTPAFPSPGLRSTFLLIERPDVAFDGSRFLVTWTSFRNILEDHDFQLIGEIRVTGVDATTGVAGTSQPGVLSDSQQEWAAVSFDGKRHLVVWHERGADGWVSLRASRIEDATRTIGDSFLITKAASNQVFPRLAHGDGQHLVVWWDQGGDRLLAVRVRDADGAIVDATPIVLPASPGRDWDHPRWDVASDGRDFLVVWVREKGAQAIRVRGTDGSVDVAPFTVATAAGTLRFPTVVHTGGGYLMAWAEGSPTYLSETKRMVATRISHDGAISNPTGETVAEINNWVKGTALAANADGALLAWGGAYPYAVWGRRLRANGTAIDGANLSLAPSLSTPRLTERIAAAFDGQRYVVAWTTSPTPYQYDLHGTSVNLDGTLQGAPFPISAVTGAVADMGPAFSVAGPGRVLVTYDRLAHSPGYPVRRSFVRWLGDGPTVDAGAPLADTAAPVDTVPSPVDVAPPPPADVAPPPPPDVAPPPVDGSPPQPGDAAVPADATPFIQDAIPPALADAATAPHDSEAPAPDVSAAVDAVAGVDAAVPPDAVPVIDAGHATDPIPAIADGSVDRSPATIDAPPNGDATVFLDTAAGQQGGPSPDGSQPDATTMAARDGAQDASAGGGAGGDCSCDVGGAPRTGGGLAWLVVPLLALLRRRRRH